MMTCTPESDNDSTIGGGDIRHRTVDQTKALSKAAAKVAKHGACQESKCGSGGDPHEGMADPADGYGM